MQLHVSILATVFLLGLGPAHAQDASDKTAAPKSTLRLKYTEGSTHHYSMTTSTDMTVALPNGEMKMKMEQEIQFESKVVGVKDGIATISSKYLRVRMRMDSAVAKIDYDSERDEDPPRTMESLGGLVGAVFEVKSDERGKILDVKTPETLDMDALGKMGMGDFKSMFERVPMVLPEQPVGIGDTWQADGSMALGQMGEFKFKSGYKLIRLEGGKAWLEVTMAADMDGMQAPAGVDMKLALDDSKGTVVLDLDKGTSDMAMSMGMKMDMSSEDPPMKIRMEGNVDTRMKLTDPPAPKAAREEAAKPAAEPAPVKKDGK